jgi:diguanylate cyclase
MRSEGFMNRVGDLLLHKLEGMSVMRQTTLMVGVALVGANALTTLFYATFFQERLLLDLFFTSIIVIVVGYPLGYLFIGQNVRLREMAVELDRVSRIDELTGLCNRRSFMRRAGSLFHGAESAGGALLYIDVDNFKQLNDVYGHAAGDSFLQRMGTIIAGNVRHGDVAARIGGEEFTVYMPGCDLAGARRVAETVSQQMRGMSRDLGGDARAGTISIGIGIRAPGQSLESLMREADRNLYAAKHRGRDRIVAPRSEAA